MTTESTTANETPRLGTVYLPRSGTPVGSFSFLVDRDQGHNVQIGTPVAADTREGTVVGTVVDMSSVGHLTDPFGADLLGGGDRALDDRQEALLATVQVFHSTHLRPVRAGEVRPATRDEMIVATGGDKIDWPIPAGAIELLNDTDSGLSLAPALLDGHSLIGPEAAHLMVGGLSGMASKTSFTGVLLRAAVNAGSPDQDSTAALIFNVKGDDLLYLDEPPAAGYELTDEDHAIYEAMGVPATPFADVTVYAAGLPNGGGTRSVRDDAVSMRWDLRTIWPYLKYFWPYLYEDDKLSGFISQFESLKLWASNPQERITSFQQLDAWMRSEIADADDEGRSECWNGRVHIATMRKLSRMFSGLPARAGGLLATESLTQDEDVPVEGWRHGQVVVVDIAGLSPEVQGVVIARTVERVLKAAEEGHLGVDHLVVMMDEANQFAPSVGGEVKNVRRILQKAVTTGRYAGVSVWAMGQKLSKLDELIRDNASTTALGRCAAGELEGGTFGRLPGGLVERIMTLPKGRMALWHYTLRSALVIRFPRPAWRTGKAKTTGNAAGPRPKRKAAVDTLGIRDEGLSRLTAGLDAEHVDMIVSGAHSVDEAVDKLRGARVVDARDTLLDHGKVDFDADDPFALGD